MLADSPRCWPLLLLATSTLAVFAPLPAAPSARPDSILRDVAVMPGDVMLDEPGEGPRELLRYGIPHDLQVDFRVELRDAASYVVVTGQCTLGQAPLLDKLEADCTVERVILGPRELARMWIYATIDRRGQATSLRARHDPRLSHALADQIAVALVRFEPLPEQAVGAGAVWQETALVTQGTAQVARTRRVSLVASHGSTIELRTTTTDAGGDQGDLVELRASGVEERTFDLATFRDHLGASRSGIITTRGPRTEPVVSSLVRSTDPGP
jgi:hypothetical protein